MSLRAYVREVLANHVAVPSTAEWLERLQRFDPVLPADQSGARLVAEARAEDDGLVGW